MRNGLNTKPLLNEHELNGEEERILIMMILKTYIAKTVLHNS